MAKIRKIIKYNLAQLIFFASAAKVIVLEWGRGTGKSFILAKRMIDCIHEMPRSTGIIYGETYMQIKSRTLPSTIDALEQHGYFLGLHFFIGEFPPREWIASGRFKTPYQKITDPKNAMFWYNGTAVIFVSQDGNATSGRGLNGDWLLGDEAMTYNGAKFMTDASATIRGNLKKKAVYADGTWKYFEECNLHHSIMLVSSTALTLEGQWFFQYEEAARNPKNKTFYLRASAVVNLENLGADFFKNQKAIMPDFLYNAEILNKRIGTVTDGFYPKLHEPTHCYNRYNLEYYQNLKVTGEKTNCLGDDDIDSEKPLIIGVDWGANINCMVVCQNQKEINEFRFLNALFVKSPKILDDLAIDEFIPYYEPHRQRNNKLFLFYDPSGNVSVANSKQTYAQQFKKVLEKHGWNVELMTRAMYNVEHLTKYNLWNDLLTETNEQSRKQPKIRFNKHNCKNLWISMTNAPAKRGTKTAVQKVKTSEKRKSFAQEHATHFSDTADVVIVGMFMKGIASSENMPAPMIL